MTITDINLKYLIDDDLRVRNSNIDLELKLDSIQRFLSNTLSNLSEIELEEFDYACEVLLSLSDEFFYNFKSLRNAKLENKAELVADLGKLGGQLLDSFNQYDISDQFVLKMCDFRLQSLEQSDLLSKGRCLLLYQILREQLMLRILLKTRTDRTPNLVTDYYDYL